MQRFSIEGNGKLFMTIYQNAENPESIYYHFPNPITNQDEKRVQELCNVAFKGTGIGWTTCATHRTKNMFVMTLTGASRSNQESVSVVAYKALEAYSREHSSGQTTISSNQYKDLVRNAQRSYREKLAMESDPVLEGWVIE